MAREEIKQALIELQGKIKEHAHYLKTQTYHPYVEVDTFADNLQDIIDSID